MGVMPSDWTGSISDSRLEGNACTVAYYGIFELCTVRWRELVNPHVPFWNGRKPAQNSATGHWRRLRSRPCDQHHSRQRCMRLPVRTFWTIRHPTKNTTQGPEGVHVRGVLGLDARVDEPRATRAKPPMLYTATVCRGATGTAA